MLSLTPYLTEYPLVFLPGHPSCPCSHISFPTFHKTFDNINVLENPGPKDFISDELTLEVRRFIFRHKNKDIFFFCRPLLSISQRRDVDQRIVAGSQRAIWGKNIIRIVVITMAIINTLVPV
jgi:hypothetical protein